MRAPRSVFGLGLGIAASVSGCGRMDPPWALPIETPEAVAYAGVERVLLEWPPVPGATSYVVRWSTAPGVSATDAELTVEEPRLSHQGLDPLETYFYVVEAVTKVGRSIPSPETSASPWTAEERFVLVANDDATVTILGRFEGLPVRHLRYAPTASTAPVAVMAHDSTTVSIVDGMTREVCRYSLGFDGTLTADGCAVLDAPPLSGVAAPVGGAWVGTTEGLTLITADGTPGPSRPTAEPLRAVVADPFGRAVYAAGEQSLYRFELQDGIPTTVTALDVGTLSGSLAVAPDGNHLLASSPDGVIAVELGAGGSFISATERAVPFPIVGLAGPLRGNHVLASGGGLIAALAPGGEVEALVGTGSRTRLVQGLEFEVLLGLDTAGEMADFSFDGSTLAAGGSVRLRDRPLVATVVLDSSRLVDVPRFLLAADASGKEIRSLALVEDTLATTQVLPVDLGSASALAIGPSLDAAFLLDERDDKLQVFSISTSHALTPEGAPLTPGSKPWAIAVEPSGRFVYVANNGSNDIAVYAIGSSGGLTAIGSAPTLDKPTGIAIEPTGRFLYLIASGGPGGIEQFRIDPVSGQLSSVGVGPAGSGAGNRVIAANPTGHRLFFAQAGGADLVWRLEIAPDGALSSAISTPSGQDPSSVSAGVGDRLYVTVSGESSVGALKINGAGFVPLGHLPTGAVPRSSALDPASSMLAVASEQGGTIELFLLDAVTGLPAATLTTNAGVAPSRVVIGSGFVP